MMPRVRREVKIYVITESECPHCKNAYNNRPIFRQVLRRPEVRVLALDDENDVHEVSALWTGLSEHERLQWAAGAQRGTPKTLAVIVDDGVYPRVRMPLGGDEDEFAMFERLASMLESVNIPLPPRVLRREREEAEVKERKKKGGRARSSGGGGGGE